MVNILASDILIADFIASVDEKNGNLGRLAYEFDLHPGVKKQLDSKAHQQLFQDAIGHRPLKIVSGGLEGILQDEDEPQSSWEKPVSVVPGGSSANTLVTLNKLLSNNANIDFLGVVGDDKGDDQISQANRMIKKSLTEANIKLLPYDVPPGVMPETALSYVLTYQSGKRAIGTYRGNAKDILTPQQITDEVMKRNDVAFMQGSLWGKLDETLPVYNGHAPDEALGVADKILKLRGKHRKELWFALPTQAKFGNSHVTHEERAKHYRECIRSSNVILGNGEEFGTVYETGANEQATLGALQEVLAERHLEQEAAAGRWDQGKTVQKAFFTRGDKGAAVVTAAGITYIKPTKVDVIVNDLGCGDTAFAGFLYGHVKGLDPVLSGKIGMLLAGEKLRVNGPRLADPQASLRKSLERPENAGFLDSDERQKVLATLPKRSRGLAASA